MLSANTPNAKNSLMRDMGVPPSAETHRAYRAAMLGHRDDELAGDALKRSSPPATARMQPPTPLVTLIDRESLVSQVQDLLADDQVRWVTLVGAGGMGKTQLALNLAHRLAQPTAQIFEHGACFVALADVGPDAVLDRTRRAVQGVREGMAVQADEVPTEGADLVFLIDALRHQHCVLVLDNCEHVTAGLSWVADLLLHCPRVKVLATSRRPLHAAAERVVLVPPLRTAANSALALFKQRAQAVNPNVK
jgi:predicted ATPase